jgi:hypothetical protein
VMPHVLSHAPGGEGGGEGGGAAGGEGGGGEGGGGAGGGRGGATCLHFLQEGPRLFQDRRLARGTTFANKKASKNGGRGLRQSCRGGAFLLAVAGCATTRADTSRSTSRACSGACLRSAIKPDSRAGGRDSSSDSCRRVELKNFEKNNPLRLTASRSFVALHPVSVIPTNSTKHTKP